MNTCLRAATATALAFSAATAAYAQTSEPNKASLEATYRQERAKCMEIVDDARRRATCLYEARSSFTESRAGTAATPDAGTRERNALARCEVHKEADLRQACERMVEGEGSVSGSVEGGGVMRELVIVEKPAS
jgi:hypothetical protein